MEKVGRVVAIGKHDDNFNFLNDCNIDSTRIRLGSYNPAKLKWINYNLISTNEKFIRFNSKDYIAVDFFELAKTTQLDNIMVLTRKEYEYVLELSVDFGLKIKVFEECFPFYKNVRYVSNLSDNINQAQKLLNECKSLNLNGGSAFKYLTTLFQYKQERKLRFKSRIDDIVYFSCIPPYQEVFKAKESRKDRLIFALDFNAMFTDCLSGRFPSPKNLKYSRFKNNDYYEIKIYDGFYRAKFVEAKNTFFLKYHPFKFCTSNRSFNFNLSEGDSIEVFISRDEIEYYSKYFLRVEIIEGIYSEVEINHPLSELTKAIFKERKSFPPDSPRSQLAKLKANIISSLGNPKRYRSFDFKDQGAVISKVEDLLSIEFDSDLTQEQILELAKRGKKIHLYDDVYQNYKCKIFDKNNADAIYTLYSKMISNSRIKMMTLIEKLLTIDTLELCYANVDSLHISIHKSDEGRLIELISSDISEDIGGLKIEAVASSAYWFDLGRYWLLNNKSIIKYGNYLFNSSHNENPITSTRRIKKVASLYGFRYVKNFSMNIYNTFSFNKAIGLSDDVDDICYQRYDLDDVCSASVASTSMNKEKLRSHFLKSALFQELATVECSSNITPKL
jgi:hypothetical protein